MTVGEKRIPRYRYDHITEVFLLYDQIIFINNFKISLLNRQLW